MAEETIEVTIGADGTVGMHVEGIAGTGCLDATAALVRLLGGEVTAQQLTAEAYVDTEEHEQEQDRLWR